MSSHSLSNTHSHAHTPKGPFEAALELHKKQRKLIHQSLTTAGSSEDSKASLVALRSLSTYPSDISTAKDNPRGVSSRFTPFSHTCLTTAGSSESTDSMLPFGSSSSQSPREETTSSIDTAVFLRDSITSRFSNEELTCLAFKKICQAFNKLNPSRYSGVLLKLTNNEILTLQPNHFKQFWEDCDPDFQAFEMYFKERAENLKLRKPIISGEVAVLRRIIHDDGACIRFFKEINKFMKETVSKNHLVEQLPEILNVLSEKIIVDELLNNIEKSLNKETLELEPLLVWLKEKILNNSGIELSSNRIREVIASQLSIPLDVELGYLNKSNCSVVLGWDFALNGFSLWNRTSYSDYLVSKEFLVNMIKGQLMFKREQDSQVLEIVDLNSPEVTVRHRYEGRACQDLLFKRDA